MGPDAQRLPSAPLSPSVSVAPPSQRQECRRRRRCQGSGRAEARPRRAETPRSSDGRWRGHGQQAAHIGEGGGGGSAVLEPPQSGVVPLQSACQLPNSHASWIDCLASVHSPVFLGSPLREVDDPLGDPSRGDPSRSLWWCVQARHRGVSRMLLVCC